MKNFTMRQMFTMINAMDDKTHVFAKGVDASGKEAYAFVLDKGIYNRTTKEEMTEIFVALQKEGWKYGTTMDVVDIPILGKEPKTRKTAKAEKATKTAKTANKVKEPKTAKTTAAPKEPNTKVKAPSKWLFPKKVGRKTTWSADNFDYELYKKIAEELGVWNEAKGKVNSTDREKVYEAMGAKLNPEWVAWNEKNGGRKNG